MAHLSFNTTDDGAVLEGYAVTELPGYVSGGTPTTTSFPGPSTLNAADDFYNGTRLEFLTGRNAGQTRVITDYTGSSQLFTFAEAWPFAPLDGDRFVIHDAPVDLTGGSVTVLYSVNGAASSTASATLDTTVRGKNRFTYQWGATDLSKGTLKTQIKATASDGTFTHSVDPVFFEVGDPLP